MPLRIKILTILFILLGIHTSDGAEFSVTGKYQGKNIYVHNPFAENRKDYCTEAVYVNDRLVLSNPISSAFEVDLSYLPLNSLIEIKIISKEGCAPAIVNPQVITLENDFKFLTLQVTSEEVKWITKKEPFSGSYTIERLDGEDWVEVAEVLAKGAASNNFYKLSTAHKEGLNIYRIKFTQPEGVALYSREINYQYTNN